MSNRLFYIIASLLLFVYLFNGLIAIPKLSVTYDEGDHLNYAIRVLKGHPEKVIPFDDASTMPISSLNAVPRAIEQILNKGLQKNDGGVSDILNGRYATLFVCFLIGVFICRWSAEAFGKEAGLFSLFLFVVCPNLNANAWLVTTDAYTALFVLMTSYFFYRFILYSGWINFLSFSILIGLSQAVKQSLILLFFFFAIISLMVLVQRKSLFSRIQINLVRLFVFIIVVVFFINAAFLFNGTGRSLEHYSFYSDFFQRVQKWSFVKGIPVPLPVPFIEGFDLVKYMLQLGSGHQETSPQSYILGSYFTGKGPWYYYPLIILFKTPLSIFLLLILLHSTTGKMKGNNFWATGYPLLLSLLFVLTVILLNTSQHSIRHLILIYPLIYVSLGGVFQFRLKWHKVFIPCIAVYSIVTFYSYYPNLIAYTNEMLWKKKDVYKVLASTNIDFGQCNNYLENYLSAHKNVKWPGANPEAGEFILDINSYLDLRLERKYKWLQNFKPIAHMNHCYLLFRISDQELKTASIK